MEKITNSTFKFFKEASNLERRFYKFEDVHQGTETLENFARIGSNLYLRTQLTRHPNHPHFFKCTFLVGPEYTECTLFSRGLHVLTLQELRNIEELINEKLFCEELYGIC